MTVNNSIQVTKLMSFDKDDFYFLQIIKRRKDNPDMERGEDILKNYYIESIDEYIKLIPSIIKLSDFENARAYMKINKRNYTDLAMNMNKRVVEYIASGQTRSLKNAFDAVTSRYHSDKDKKWIVDIDWVDLEDKCRLDIVLSDVVNLQIEGGREPMTEIIPTKNGVHFITRPFNLKKFKELYPKVSVHRDNHVLVYCP